MGACLACQRAAPVPPTYATDRAHSETQQRGLLSRITTPAAQCSAGSEAGCDCEGEYSGQHTGPTVERRCCGLCLEPQYTHERLYTCPGCGTDVCVPKCRPSLGDFYSPVCSRCVRMSAVKSLNLSPGGETAPQRVPHAFLAEALLSEHDPDYAQARRQHAAAVKHGARIPVHATHTDMYVYDVKTVRASLPRDPLNAHYHVKWAPVYGEDRFTRCGVCTPQPCAFVGVGTAVHCRMCGRAGCLMQAGDWPLLKVPGLQGLAPTCLRCADDYVLQRLHEEPGLWPYSFPYERSQESHWADPRGSIAIRMYKESHESGPPFRYWEPPCPTKLLDALVRLLRRTYELPVTDDDRHMQAPLHQLLDLDKNEPHSEVKDAAVSQALGGNVTPRLLAHVSQLLDLERLPWAHRTNPLPTVPLPEPYQLLGLPSVFASAAMIEKAKRCALALVHPDGIKRRLRKIGAACTDLDVARERELDNQRRELIHRAYHTLQDRIEVQRLLKDYAKALLAA